MTTIPGVGPSANGPPERQSPVQRQESADQLRQFTERKPVEAPPPPPPEDQVEVRSQPRAEEPPPPPPPAETTTPPRETAPTAQEAATSSDASTTATYNEQNPDKPVVEQEIGGTVNVKI